MNACFGDTVVRSSMALLMNLTGLPNMRDR